ncbi:MAG: tryptophan 7-halogenase [Pirellulaceae bacterium]|nr:tryptophan 7-halogenase [Pirellulaceae bacterium]
MTRIEADVAVLGAGFGGSLTSLVLRAIGLRPVLLDRGRHPRFAIGESSTPVANLVLSDLARQYDLPRLAPLAKYGTWMRAYPQVVRGPKRGFSYFQQAIGQPFAADTEHSRELLVAASHDLAHADTHWLRSDVDQFLAAEVQASGIAYLDQTEVTIQRSRAGWLLAGQRAGRPVQVTARLLIDATGPAGVLLRHLGQLGAVSETQPTPRLRTNSYAVYGHFADVLPWQQCLEELGAAVGEHPFPCDQAALHHLLDEGWMWQLRFDNGVTSAGFVLRGDAWPAAGTMSPTEQWHACLERYPSLTRQFARARLVAPAGGVQRSGRLQRLASQIAGPDWVLLPHTAGFIDPLHSTGIAQTLCGIERLARALAGHWDRPSLSGELAEYARCVRRELELIDELVAGCYAARGRFDLFVPFSMLYFAAATTYERRRMRGEMPAGAALLCADDDHLQRLVRGTRQRLDSAAAGSGGSSAEKFAASVAADLAPYNSAGLLDPACRNMYRYTALPA